MDELFLVVKGTRARRLTSSAAEAIVIYA